MKSKKNFNHKESFLSKESPYIAVCTYLQSKDRIFRNIGYLKNETRPYIPNPQRCFQCQKFGHTKNSCKSKAVCAGCGEKGHNLDDCQNEPKCVNCQCDHVAISRDCPKWKIEKDIVTLKYTEKISFTDARKRLQPSFDQSKDSYATVTQTPRQSSRPLPPWARKIRLPIDFRTEIEYLKYIFNYCLTRLDTLDEITPENPVPRVAPSSDETPPPPQTTSFATQSIAPPDTSAAENVDDEMDYTTVSTKRGRRHDSSDEEPNSPRTKKPASGSPVSGQDGTLVPKGREGGDLPKISSFPANAPQPRGREPSQGDKSPRRSPRFATNTNEGSVTGEQGPNGRDRSPIRHPNGEKPRVANKPSHLSKSKTNKNSNALIMAHSYIIQWNCRGLGSNGEDIELLISKYSPPAICLQETLLKPNQTQTFRHYSAYYKNDIRGHGGVCILVKKQLHP